MTIRNKRELRQIANSRPIQHVVVLGANGTMGYGSAALFTSAVPRVSFVARTKEKAQSGIDAAIRQVRSETVARHAEVASYDELEDLLQSADIIFEAVAEDPAIKSEVFARVDSARRSDAIVATVSSGLSINGLCAGRSESFKRHFCGLHFFNPANVIVGTELIGSEYTDPDVLDFLEAFSRVKLGREIIRTEDTAGFAGNRVGFKVLNEAARLVSEFRPSQVEKIIGPYTGRFLTPLRTIDLVGWDVHAAIVDNIVDKVDDEAIETLHLPDYMRHLIPEGYLGSKAKKGFFRKGEQGFEELDPETGEYAPISNITDLDFGYIAPIAKLYSHGRYKEGLQLLLDARGEAAIMARKVLAGYISYAFHRVGEVCESIDGIDRIMATGFNWAPPGLLVDTMGVDQAVILLEDAGVPVPGAFSTVPAGGYFQSKTLNPGRYFVAA